MTLVNAKEISTQFAIPLPTVYYYVEKGILPCYKIGGRKKFDILKVGRILKQGETAIARTW